MDISWLPEEERKALLVGHAKGMMDTARRAGELHVEANNVRENLHTFSELEFGRFRRGSMRPL
jgi:hypothetical protein